jgi:predicted MFS family arabinose efflux permease
MGLLGYSGFLAFIALHAESIGVSSSGLVFALFASIVVAVRLLGARIPDQLGSLATTRLSLGFSATGLAVFGLWTSPTGVYVGAVVMALGQCFLFPALFVLTVDRAPESERSHAIGSFSVAFDLAVGLGGFLVGGVVALTDRPGGFLFCSMVAVGSLLATGPLLGEIGATARSEAGQPT